MIGLVTEEGGEGEEGEEKAIVRSAPDGSDNKECEPKGKKVRDFLFCKKLPLTGKMKKADP